ncbi:MAG: hypothetical protein GX607_05050 [Myxococcales bacterium]|nr:hypothetical protein [Myxococcales bacterium]
MSGRRALDRRSLLGGLGAAALGVACAKSQEVIVETAAGLRVDDARIDEDPWALLPSGAVSWWGLGARELFAAKFGPQVVALLQRTLPVPTGSGYEPGRDVDAVALGLYTFSGVDVAGIATGRFDANGFEQAATQGARTVTGRPVTRTTYAGRPLFLSDGVGLTVLTSRTMAFGNEVGIRRVLDRIEEGRVARATPAWFEELLSAGAPLAWGVDLAAHPLPDAARRQVQFLDGLRAARLLGNFQEPGINLAGTLTYDAEEAAQRGVITLRASAEALRTYEWLMALVGILQPVRRLDAQVQGTEAQVVAEVDGAAVGSLLGNAERLIAMVAG